MISGYQPPSLLSVLEWALLIQKKLRNCQFVFETSHIIFTVWAMKENPSCPRQKAFINQDLKAAVLMYKELDQDNNQLYVVRGRTNSYLFMRESFQQVT